MQKVFLLVTVVIAACGLVFGIADSTQQQKPAEPEGAVLNVEKSSSPMKITRAVTCRAIENREPLAVADKFPKDVGQVYCFCQVEGTEANATVVHKWYYRNSLVGNVALRIKADKWRTFSYKTIASYMAGEWKVEVVNGENDEVLEIVKFAVE